MTRPAAAHDVLRAFQRYELVKHLEPVIREKAREKQQESGGPVPQKSAEPPVDTRFELAKAAGVSHDTIAKAQYIDRHAGEETKAALRSNETSINSLF